VLYVIAHADTRGDPERPRPELAVRRRLLELHVILPGQRQHSLRRVLRHPSLEREPLFRKVVDAQVDLRCGAVADDLPR